jgi:glycerol-3-phosphate acyltransferase PlsY
MPIFWAIGGWPYLLFGFVLGSIPFGVVIGRVFFHTDIRDAGSGNIGAANALRTFGRKAGAAILVLDALKGAVAVGVAARLGLGLPVWFHVPGAAPLVVSAPPVWPLIPLAGLAAVVGHCYSPWLRFRGGKGVATFLGATFALSWESGLAFVATWLVLVLPTGYSSLGSLAATLVAGIALGLVGTNYGYSGVYFAFWSLALIVWKHRENLARLVAGTENRTPLLKR